VLPRPIFLTALVILHPPPPSDLEVGTDIKNFEIGMNFSKNYESANI
jgi:hypothetical protein